MSTHVQPLLFAVLVVFTLGCQKEGGKEVNEPAPTPVVTSDPAPVEEPSVATAGHYLPEELAEVKIGMSIDAYESLKQSDSVKVVVSAEAIEEGEDIRYKGLYYLEQKRSEASMESVTYQFSKGKLYEVMVVVGSPELALAMAEDLMAMPANNGEKWKLPANAEGITLIAWVYQNKFILADSSHF